MSGLQVLTPAPANPDVRNFQKIQELERRIEALERRGTVVPVVTGAPTGGANGQVAARSDTNRLVVKIGGTWYTM